MFTYNGVTYKFAFKTNAQVGEIWNMGTFNTITGNPMHGFVKVDSVYFQNYNGTPLRNLRIHSCDSVGNSILYEPMPSDTGIIVAIALSPFGNNYNTGIINEKFGPLNFDGIGLGISNDFINEYSASGLLCYESNNFTPYPNNSTDCFGGIFNEINEQEENSSLSIYPNPATETLNISNSQNIFSYQINLLDGSCVYNGNTFPINIAQLANGIYFLTLTDKHKQQTNYKFIKN